MSLRDNPLGELKVPLTWAAAIALVVAVVAATAILLSDRRETFKAEAYGVSRRASDKVLAPVGDVLATPGRWTGAGVDSVRDYFAAGSQNRELKAELKEMKQWRDVAIALKDENARYRTLLGLKTDPPIPMVAARIVTDSRGPFAEDTRLLPTPSGENAGVKAGNPVMSENGLVGRVIGVTNGASRVLLLTDVASRTPVMVDRTNARSILTGDGGPNPRLDYLRRGRDPIREGDRLLTSGDGGVLPRGLPVGTAVKGLDGRWRVVLASDRAAIDFVRILLFEDFTQVVNVKALNEMPTPPPTPGAGVEAGGDCEAFAAGECSGVAKPAGHRVFPLTPTPASSAASAKGAAEASALTAAEACRRSLQTLKPASPKSRRRARPLEGQAEPALDPQGPGSPRLRPRSRRLATSKAVAAETRSQPKAGQEAGDVGRWGEV